MGLHLFGLQLFDIIIGKQISHEPQTVPIFFN